jgi:molecular chaperone GrpE
MNDNKSNASEKQASEATATSTAKPERRTSEEAAWEEVVDRLEAQAGEVARLESEKADLTDRLVRLAADMDNLRKRTERDITDTRKYALTKFAGDMLVVADNLKRTLAAIPADKRAAGDDTLKALVEGVEVTEREMDRLLERHGVTRIAAEGERFDPHLHQAMFEVPDASVPAGTVVQVVQDGYQIGDRVLRAAMVGVAKALDAAPTASPSSNGSNQS